jgi:hypothetical protein
MAKYMLLIYGDAQQWDAMTPEQGGEPTRMAAGAWAPAGAATRARLCRAATLRGR